LGSWSVEARERGRGHGAALGASGADGGQVSGRGPDAEGRQRSYTGGRVGVLKALFGQLIEAKALDRLGDPEWLGPVVTQLSACTSWNASRVTGWWKRPSRALVLDQPARARRAGRGAAWQLVGSTVPWRLLYAAVRPSVCGTRRVQSGERNCAGRLRRRDHTSRTKSVALCGHALVSGPVTSLSGTRGPAECHQRCGR
jgi:hypothetical protein